MPPMLNTQQIMDALLERGITNAAVARLLGIAPSRIKDIRDGTRRLQREEAIKVVEEYGLEPPPPENPEPPEPMLPTARVVRMAVRYVARAIEAEIDDDLATELAAELLGFFSFAGSQPDRIRDFETFLEALAIRRSTQAKDQPEDHLPGER